jgi:hypothetical protein
MPETHLAVLARLVPEVREYRTPCFALADDLGRLVAVRGVGAAEAVILYGARILETLSGEAVRRLHQEPVANAFANLQLLEHLNRFGVAVGCWAHALRRTGNQVRHVRGPVGPAEADVSTLFAERWLDWFFCRFSHGARLPGLSADHGLIGLGAGEELRSLVRAIENLEETGHGADAPAAAARLADDPAFLQTPALAGVLAEILLGRAMLDEARRVLSAGRERFPEDLRLRQLMGLYWKRRDDPDRALAWLEPLYAQDPTEGETAGITAGAYKQKWLRDRADVRALERSHRAYRNAWKSSKRENVYLGINAATTALWLGNGEEARRLAREVEALLRRRAATLPRDLAEPGADFSFWDHVTLAEAQLLQGGRAAAERSYDEAFGRHAGRRGDIDVCRQQRDEILQALARQQAGGGPAST